MYAGIVEVKCAGWEPCGVVVRSEDGAAGKQNTHKSLSGLL